MDLVTPVGLKTSWTGHSHVSNDFVTFHRGQTDLDMSREPARFPLRGVNRPSAARDLVGVLGSVKGGAD